MTAADIRLGRWQDVLADVECDACIFDAPYGARTHKGHDASKAIIGTRELSFKPLGYGALTDEDAHAVVDHWSPRTRGWLCSLTSHDLIPAWESALAAAGRYVFAPLPIIDRGSRPRLTGDGPACWSVWMIVARPRTAAFSRWGSLPGVYQRELQDQRPAGIMGGKPLGVMRAIVRDYSRSGDLVCDPFAGHGTTLKAAVMEGRRAVGSEVDPDAHAACVSRLSDTPTMPARDGTLALF